MDGCEIAVDLVIWLGMLFYWFSRLHGVIVKILRYCALRVVQYTVL